MQQTERYIRDCVRHKMPELVEEIKEKVAEQLCSNVLKELVNVEEGVKFNFYLEHYLVRDVKVIIGEEIAQYLQKPPVVKQQLKVQKKR